MERLRLGRNARRGAKLAERGPGEAQEDAVVVDLRLDVDAGSLAQRIGQRQRPRAVDAPAERRVHDRARLAHGIRKRLDDDLLIRRDAAERVELAIDVIMQVDRGVTVQQVRLAQPRDDLLRLVLVQPDLRRHLATQPPDAHTQFVGPPRIIAVPERHPRQMARSIGDDYPVVLDRHDAPDVRAEQEGVARPRLEDKLLIQRADARLPVSEVDIICAGVGDGAGVVERQQPRAGQRRQPVVDAVPRDARAQRRVADAADALEAARQHRQHGFPCARGQVCVRICLPDEPVERIGIPRLHGDGREHLLGQHVQRVARGGRLLDIPRAHPGRDGCRLHEVLAMRRVDAPATRLPDHVARPPDALEPLAHALGRLELDDEVHHADVDAQFQRPRADQRGKPPCLEVFFHLAPRLARHAAVVRADGPLRADGKHAAVARDAARRQRLGAARRDFLRTFRRNLRVEPVRGPLRQPAIVGEDERGAVAHHVAQHLRDNGRPDGRAGQVAEILHRRHDLQVERLPVTRVHDSHGPGCWRSLSLPGPRSPGCACRFAVRQRVERLTPQEPRGLLQRAHGCGQPDALDASTGEVFEPFEAQREMHSALLPDESVDFVHDDRPHGLEHIAGARAGQDQVERFRRGDEDVRRLAHHRLAGRGRGVARAHGDVQRRKRLT